jgi:hypothetical protein
VGNATKHKKTRANKLWHLKTQWGWKCDDDASKLWLAAAMLRAVL